MNKKAFLEDINPVFLLIAIVGGVIGAGVAAYGSEGKLIPAMAFVISTIGCYIYVVATDR